MNTITVIEGRRGHGKTLLMTALGYYDQKAGRKVFANYHLNYPYTYITIEEISKLPPELEDATVLIDEGQVGADSREIFKSTNKGITHLITQLRKRKITMYITTQKIKYLDKRIREQMDQSIHMLKMGDQNHPTHFKAIIIDRTMPLPDAIKEQTHLIFEGHHYFGLYDTNEIITLDGD